MPIILLKDVIHGDCWMYSGKNAPDRRPSVTTRYDEGEPPEMPDSWDDYGLPRPADFENPESYIRCNGDREVELLEHFSVSPTPRPLKLKRRDLRDGDCFQYLDDSKDIAKCISVPYIVDGPNVSLAGMPSGWLTSTETSSKLRLEAPVRRYPHWDRTRPPVHIDALTQILEHTANGLTGAECLTRLEKAMRYEHVVRQQTGFISTLGEDEVGVIGGINGGLDHQQFALGQAVWAEKLRHLQKEAREKDRLQVVVDCDVE